MTSKKDIPTKPFLLTMLLGLAFVPVFELAFLYPRYGVILIAGYAVVFGVVGTYIKWKQLIKSKQRVPPKEAVN